MKRLYLRDYEKAPDGATLQKGRLGGRYFEYETRDDYLAWFLARPGLRKQHEARTGKKSEKEPKVAV